MQAALQLSYIRFPNWETFRARRERSTTVKVPSGGKRPNACPGDCCVSSERMTVRILEGKLVMISWEMRKEEEMPNPLMC